jgi:hypothetical protein
MTLLRTMEEVSPNRLSLMSWRVPKACARFGCGTFLHLTLYLHLIDMDGLRLPRLAARRRLLSLASSGRRQSQRRRGFVRVALQRADVHPLSAHEIPSDDLLRFEMEALLFQYPEGEPRSGDLGLSRMEWLGTKPSRT